MIINGGGKMLAVLAFLPAALVNSETATHVFVISLKMVLNVLFMIAFPYAKKVVEKRLNFPLNSPFCHHLFCKKFFI